MKCEMECPGSPSWAAGAHDVKKPEEQADFEDHLYWVQSQSSVIKDVDAVSISCDTGHRVSI